ncbi:hypothetical protein J3458_002184 [Metarhizium acridum]|uniref:uncharacterized protein n=1 Tax=Metarhizium acridum TaxID=92637 RepID=UPI001C6C1BB3|nr:hypothetical protein J3458_002184 [Metarhizium acridum]
MLAATPTRSPSNKWNGRSLARRISNSPQWMQMAMWGFTAVSILIGYRPRKRYTVYHEMPLGQKIKALDLIGVGLFASGLTLFLGGLNLGNGQFAWTDSKVLSTLIIGLVTLLAFTVIEWRGTKVGIARYDLFRKGISSGRTFSIFIALIFIEGIVFFSFSIFYAVL